MKTNNMADLLKNEISKTFVCDLARDFGELNIEFRSGTFKRCVMRDAWTELELKQRIRRISGELRKHLPADLQIAIPLVVKVSKNYSGLKHLVFPDFIEQFGLETPDSSLEALAEITSGSSSEFAVRPYIESHPQKTLSKLKLWSKSNCEHIRRLSSEACRPRLPWAKPLTEFKLNPEPVLEIILPLLNDPSQYVRKSVANNLNDISKDHPAELIQVVSKNLGKSKQVDWVLKHASRTLLKRADPDILTLFGFTSPSHIRLAKMSLSDTVMWGKELEFSFMLSSQSQMLGLIRVEFAIAFVKANGNLSRKVFKISESRSAVFEKCFKKMFSFKPITTRRYYPGTHYLELIVNGEIMAKESFELVHE
ncbi:MAG: DNA alkylation repair protein [Kangiellaceae bacterium]|nr:DNA alkylation repair protein [Kangiellaceae bacterium]MCW8998782.1 DNA alkylation repair protein [Kangiellaceae bacterium]